MKLATREQIALIDQLAEQRFGLPKDQLIRTAGKALAAKFLSLAGKYSLKPSLRYGVWCGPGNNGADGRAMAKELANHGYLVEVVQGAEWNCNRFDVVFDALFGVGLNKPIEGNLRTKMQELENSQCIVIAIDLPSGLSANTGQVLGVAVRAKLTLTIYPPKPGLFLQQGPKVAGRIHTVHLKFPKELFREQGVCDTYLVTRAFARTLLPPRSSTSNKTSFGHLLVVAGSPGMEGAASLVCEAAARMGCGYVTLCSLSQDAWQVAKPDFLRLTPQDLLKSDLKKYSAVVIGPGLGKSAEGWALLQHVQAHHSHVLVDADGLNLLAEHRQFKLPPGWIVTPHAGELSRLIEVKAADLEADRLHAVQRAQEQLQCVVLLKGFRTVLRAKEKNFIIYSGNVALAKAGSGDVLSGFIGSLMAQGLSAERAGVLGAYLHGKIADDWVQRAGNTRTLMASDLSQQIDATLRRLKKPV